MPEDARRDRPQLSAVERRVQRSLDGEDRHGRPIPTEELHRERSVENYLRGAVMPRWMERLRDIESGTRRHRSRLAADYAWLREQHAGDPEAFARAWRALVDARSFEDVNDLVRDHNEWYPVERQLPMDPRTGEYVLIAGRPYTREELTADWALAEFPPDPR
ncbi:MAG TPA: hypothetical protein VNT55_16410 [Baekduia sp.]|nr:hypothetical protein [Baekduia sp.]